MERPYFLDEVVREIQFKFELLDENKNTKPTDDGHEPEWKYEDEWDDEFKAIRKWVNNHGSDDLGQWEIAHDHQEDAWVHQYTYKDPRLFTHILPADFSRLSALLQHTSKEVSCRISGKLGEYDRNMLDELKEDIREECWTGKHTTSYLIGPEEKIHYVAYELEGIPANKNGTVMVGQDNRAFFVGHEQTLDNETLPSEAAKVFRGKMECGKPFPNGSRLTFGAQSLQPSQIYDIAEDIFASHEIGYMEENK